MPPSWVALAVGEFVDPKSAARLSETSRLGADVGLDLLATCISMESNR